MPRTVGLGASQPLPDYYLNLEIFLQKVSICDGDRGVPLLHDVGMDI
jgi:hypothetical protein